MINFPRLTMRNINRIVLLMALAAPIVYLFGTQFSALAGSHGEITLAEEAPEVVDMDFEYDGVSYQRIIYNDVSSVVFRDTGCDFYVLDGNRVYGTGISSVDNMTIVNSLDGHGIRLVKSSLASDSTLSPYNLGGYGVTFWCAGRYWEMFGSYVFRYDVLNHTVGADYKIWWEDVNNLHFDFAYNYSPADLAWLSSVARMPLRQPITQEAHNMVNSEYLFGQMFPRDNFLVEWGNNSISNEPYGFAPIGTFFKYLDDNLLHFSANGAQFGLMSYGYMYYAAHVLLFDLVFYCGTFFISLIKGIVDKFTGGFEK